MIGLYKTSDAWNWLIAGCAELSEYAGRYGIALAFEPEPGMFIENLTQYQSSRNWSKTRCSP